MAAGSEIGMPNLATIAPSSKSFRRVSTRAVPARDRLDYWRTVHDTLELSVTDPAIARDYRASLLLGQGSEGVMLGQATCSSTTTRFGRHDNDLVLLTGIIRGVAGVGPGDGVRLAPSSPLALLDCGRQTTVTAPGGFSHLYLALPRPMVVDALGEDPVPGKQALRTLPERGLFPLLWAHMRKLAADGENLTVDEGDAAIAAARDLALAALRQLRADATDKAPDEALFTAAKRFIEMRRADSDMTAAGIAAALGCSRAHLYRVFGGHGYTVGGYMRATRLEMARTMLASRTPRSIAQVAHDTGYASQATFSRAFHDRFGMTPGAWRARTNAD